MAPNKRKQKGKAGQHLYEIITRLLDLTLPWYSQPRKVLHHPVDCVTPYGPLPAELSLRCQIQWASTFSLEVFCIYIQTGLAQPAEEWKTEIRVTTRNKVKPTLYVIPIKKKKKTNRADWHFCSTWWSPKIKRFFFFFN